MPGDSAAAWAYDFDRMAASLVDTFPSGAARRWLEESWQDPEAYRAAVFARAGRQNGAFKSRPGGAIDPYHDLVQAHTGAQRVAHIDSPDGERLRSFGYDALHTTCAGMAEAWRAAGVEAGQHVTVLSPPGLERLLCVTTGLRIGARMSVVETRGRTYVRNRLALLQPDHVVGGANIEWYDSERVALPLSGLPPTLGYRAAASHCYAPEEPMLSFVSPLAEGEEAVCTLAAADAMARMLSDALLLLPIRPGDHVTATGRDHARLGPTLMLATLAAGGCFVELDIERCEDNPELLSKAGLDVVLASPRLLELVLTHPQDLTAGWKRWSLDPTARIDWQRWWALSERLGPRGIAGMAAIYSGAFGGCVAVSPKCLRPDPLRVVPAPGLAWSLHDLTGMGAEVPVDHGVLHVEGASPAQAGDWMLAGSGAGYGLSGSFTPHVDGLPYPRREVCALVEGHPLVQHASVVVVPDTGVMNHGLPTLLLFVEPLFARSSPAQLGELGSYLQTLVGEELGAAARPQRVEVLQLTPQLVDGAVDPVWAQNQYLTGVLGAKRVRQVFGDMARLRQLFALEATGP